jgi:hypothetical protein
MSLGNQFRLLRTEPPPDHGLGGIIYRTTRIAQCARPFPAIPVYRTCVRTTSAPQHALRSTNGTARHLARRTAYLARAGRTGTESHSIVVLRVRIPSGPRPYRTQPRKDTCVVR